jgi:MFS family permease
MAVQFAVGGAVLPFVAVLLRDRGLDFTQISRVFLASSSTLLVFPFLWGWLADRHLPLNRLFTLLNLGSAAALLFLAWAQGFSGLLWGFTWFYACFNPTLLLLNALSFHHLRHPQRQFGRLRAWGSIGWLAPSLPFFLWLVWGGSQRLDFVLGLGVALAMLATATTFFLPHTPPGANRRFGGQMGVLSYWPALQRLLRHPDYLVILFSFFFIAASFSLLSFYSAPLLEDLGLERAWLGPVQALGIAFEVALLWWRPLLIDRFRPAGTLLLGCLALALRHLLFAFSDRIWVLAGSYVLAGAVVVLYHTGASLLVNEIAGLEVRATAQTLLVLFSSGLGPMFANWMAGRITAANGQNLRPLFLFAAGLAGLAGLLVVSRLNRLDSTVRGRLAA